MQTTNNKTTATVASIFDAKLKKGDLLGAVDQSLLEAEEAKRIAQEGRESLEASAAKMRELAESVLARYKTI